jgi:mannosyltransferase OCH1-like enzyme
MPQAPQAVDKLHSGAISSTDKFTQAYATDLPLSNTLSAAAQSTGIEAEDHLGSNLVASSTISTETVGAQQTGFPKKIWQIWRDDSEEPTDRTVGYPHKWRVMNPDYRYERITHANADSYVQEKVPEALGKVFLACKSHILRADLLRYLILFGEGGVWADIDTMPHRPVNEWIPDEYQNQTVNLVV